MQQQIDREETEREAERIKQQLKERGRRVEKSEREVAEGKRELESQEQGLGNWATGMDQRNKQLYEREIRLDNRAL